MNDWNFVSLVATDTNITPHEIIEAAAIDTAMMAVNDRVPEMDDAEADRLMDVAATAAQTAMRLGHVPNSWLGFLEHMPRERLPQLRHEIAGIVYEALPAKPGPLSSRRRAALEQIRALVPQEHHKALYRLILDYETADWEHLIADTDNAFALGYALGRDPSAFFFEQGSGNGE